MRTKILFVVTAILVIAGIKGSSINAQQPAKTAVPSEINKLMQERRDVFAQRVKLLEQSYAAATTTIDELIRARDQLFEAELQLATEQEQRTAILQKRVDNLRELEEVTKMRYKAGETTEEAILAVTAARLQAQIDLLREKEHQDGARNGNAEP